MMYRLLFVIAAFFNIVVKVVAVEWNCASSTSSGAFTRATDCVISGGTKVYVNGGTFELTGDNTDMDNLVQVTAASNKKHFAVDGGATITIRYIKLTGGNPSGNGGSINLNSGSGATLNVYYSIFVENKNQ